MAEGIVLSEGRLATESEGRLAQVDIDGPIRTAHDALYVYTQNMSSNGTLIPANTAATDMPRYTLANAASQVVKWNWAIPVGWNSATFRWASVNEAADAGTVDWSFAYKLYHLGEGAVNGAVDATLAITAAAPGTQGHYHYNTPAATENIALPLGFFGDSPLMMCTLTRLGSADAHAGGMSVAFGTLTRTS